MIAAIAKDAVHGLSHHSQPEMDEEREVKFDADQNRFQGNEHSPTFFKVNVFYSHAQI